MAARTAGRKGRPWRKVQARVYAEEDTCCFCGTYVDQTLANYRSPRARSVHHLTPPDIAPELANDRGNMRLAHLGCNSSYGRGAYRGAPAPGGAAVVRGVHGGARGRHAGAGAAQRGVVGVGTAVVSDRQW